MKEAEKQRKGVRHSLFKRFLMIVVILLLCMIGSFLAVDYTVRKMAESSTLSSNEKILQQIDAKTKEFHNSIYNMLTLLAYEQTTYSILHRVRENVLEAMKTFRSCFPI